MTTRYQRGIRMIKQLDAEQVGQILESVGDIAPDFAEQIIEFAFGDVYSRPGLDLRARQISTVSTLVALGSPPQIYTHLRAARRVGVSREELVEVIMQSAVYAGFPAAINAFAAAKTIFSQEGPDAGASAS
jgi:4-carboxymuconolactone decarboxylase